MNPKDNPGLYHRMPAHFGPTCGPRQFPVGKSADHRWTPKKLGASVTYLTRTSALTPILPPDFVLWGEPVVTVEIAYLTEIDWLAGRSYATFGVRFPVTYQGQRDQVNGMFLSILWENLADPIISGRDELGFSKIFCDIGQPRRIGNRCTIDCSWQGFRFFSMELSDLKESAPPPAAPAGSAGLLHWKYIPKTGAPGQADIAYATLTPAANPLVTVDHCETGTGSFVFREATWEDMPTQFHIVNALSQIDCVEFRSASLIRSHGGKDLGDQRVLS